MFSQSGKKIQNPPSALSPLSILSNFTYSSSMQHIISLMMAPVSYELAHAVKMLTKIVSLVLT